MIKFEYNGQPYSIKFKYTRTHRDKKISMLTHCHIFKGSNPLTSGLSFCLIEDNFSKETGRQISLEKAIKGLNLDPSSVGEERFLYAILDAYWNRSESSANQRKSFDELREIRRKEDVRKKIRMLERELKGLKKSIGEWT